MSIEPLSPADLGDRHRRFVAFAMLATGVLYALSAIGPLLDPGLARVSEGLELVLGLLAVGLALPIVVWKFRYRESDKWHLYEGRDGFVADTIARAHIASWAVTLFCLLALSLFGNRLSEVPPERFPEGVLAVMLITFALVFLFLGRASDDEDGEATGA